MLTLLKTNRQKKQSPDSLKHLHPEVWCCYFSIHFPLFGEQDWVHSPSKMLCDRSEIHCPPCNRHAPKLVQQQCCQTNPQLLPTTLGLPAPGTMHFNALKQALDCTQRVNFTAPALHRQEIIYNNLSGLTFWYSINFSRFKALYKVAKVHLY